MESVDRIRDTATSHVRTFIIEVMGRDAKRYRIVGEDFFGGADDIIIPEKEFDMADVAKRVQDGRDRGKNTV